TLSLACSMRKMARSNCLIRRLHAAETIGCASVICTDKTGTLTMNRMTVVDAFGPAGSDDWFAEAAAVNSTAELNGDEVLGNPTEGALLRFIKERGFDYADLRGKNQAVRHWNFSTETKYMAVELASGRMHLKGAPEIVLEKCAFVETGSGPQSLDPAGRTRILDKIRSEQAKARRTLAFAMSETPADPATASELVFLGFVAISDPVRPDVPAAVADCRAAGIKVKIVTGDTGTTAAEIAREIGLDADEVIDGRDFAELAPEAAQTTADRVSIIARARPDDKLKLVNLLKAQGEVVAVTGDGTNDAPALHHADVGVAMGLTGTAIAREASDIILLDDSFRSIVNAVLWGRSLYLNIQRFLVFQLTINLAAAVIAFSGPFFGVAMPFTVIQMLWINLIMDTFAALALAMEPPTAEVMQNPPRQPASFIVTPAMARQIAATALLFVGVFFALLLAWKRDGLDKRELSIIFSGFVFLQIWNLLNVRAFGSIKSMLTTPPHNPVFFWIVVGIAAGQIAITQLGGAVFRTTPLDWQTWVAIAVATSAVFWAGELHRLIRRLRAKR
ncbi:MAG: cation-translocating P-type ATPase, partial [Victivallaceae bacterium]|nr:cation-translocating P-type ATPase [Victivallaceae bacterium]